MRILFIYPVPPENLQMLRYQQGIGSISAVLKQAGHSTALLTLSAFDRERIDDIIRSFAPDLIAFSLTSSYYPLTREVSQHIASTWRLPVLLGGLHPTLMPEESIDTPGVFAICIGEGEYPMLELCEALEQGRDPSAIANLWIRRNNIIHRNEIRPLIQDLDALPFPDRDIFDFNKLLSHYPEAEFMGSRGCPYRCAYCANHALIGLYKGKGRYVRYRSVDNLLDEIEHVLRHYSPVEWLGFHDDTFTLNPAWLAEFTDKFPRRFNIRFWCNATARSINPEIVEMLKHAGCYEVRMGIESGNDHIRKQVLKKNVEREQIIEAFRLFKEAGINRYAFNMVGLPFETRETIEDTIRLNREVQPDQMFCSIFYPFPGTYSREICSENGWLTDRTVKSYFDDDYAIEQPSISSKEVRKYHDLFEDLVRWPRLDRLIRMLHRIPVTRKKTLWNLFRRIRAKYRQFTQRFFLAARRAAGYGPPPSGPKIIENQNETAVDDSPVDKALGRSDVENSGTQSRATKEDAPEHGSST